MMKSTGKKIIVGLALAAAVVLLGGLTYNSVQLGRQRDQLLTDLSTEQNKYKLLQHKYAEQKAVIASLQREKITIEGNLEQTRQALVTAEAEKKALLDQLSSGEDQCKQDVVKLEKYVEKYKDQIEQLIENRDQYKAKLAETVAVVKERNEMIYTLKAEKEELTVNLQETSTTLKRCVKHNGRFSQLAEELVMAYEKKGVGDSMLQSEPFTQIKKVEVEQLVQQYRDRIDNENLELISPSQH